MSSSAAKSTLRLLGASRAAFMLGGLIWLCLAVAPSVGEAYIYWGGYEDFGTETLSGLVYRANENGSTTTALGRTETPSKPTVMALGASHIYYFSDGSRTLGRSKLDGSNPEPAFLENLLTEEEQVMGMVIVGEYVYWYTSGGSTIKRAKLNGTETNREFISGLGGSVIGLASVGSYLYWLDRMNTAEPGESQPGFGSVIGRATLAGGEVNKSFISGFNYKCDYTFPSYSSPQTMGPLAANEEYLYVIHSPFEGCPGVLKQPAGIARVNIGGGAPDMGFINGFGNLPVGFGFLPNAIAATKNYVYWPESAESSGSSIARANADGSDIRRDLLCNYRNNDFSEIVEERTYFGWAGGLLADEGSSELGKPSPYCALHELAPSIRLDSQESYVPLEPRSIAQVWGEEEGQPYTNTLHYDNGEREVTSDPFISPGEVIETEEGPEPVGLNLEWIAPVYPGEVSAGEGDYVDERNGHYAEDSAHIREFEWPRPFYPIYARIVTSTGGHRWLEYWIWYYYDESEFIGSGIGSHEGDWEEVQVEINEENEPERVAFSQHASGSVCEWDAVEKEMLGRPIDYVAVGTHANYPFPGTWESEAGLPGSEDVADGEGVVVEPTIETIVSGEGWPLWPGRWGGTTAGVIPGEANSPRGPAEHGEWGEPGAWAGQLDECDARYEGSAALARPATAAVQVGGKAMRGSPAPVLEAARMKQGHLWIKYSAVDASSSDRMLMSIQISGKETPLSWTVRHVEKNAWVKVPFRYKHLPKGEVLASIFSPRAGRSEIAELPIG